MYNKNLIYEISIKIQINILNTTKIKDGLTKWQNNKKYKMILKVSDQMMLFLY